MCYDTDSDKIYYFGGEKYNRAASTWSDSRSFGTIDGKLKTVIPFSTGPSAMKNHDMIYHPELGAVMVIDDNDLWAYDGSSWSIHDSSFPGDYDNYKMKFRHGRMMVWYGLKKQVLLSLMSVMITVSL